jgi:hypothetical protein
MRSMKHTAVRNSLTALVVTALIASCTESSGPDQGASSGVENKAVLMGNFQINSGPVTTNQDGTSTNLVDDYVLPAQLPNVNFELFTTHLYAPVASDVSTTISNVRAFVTRTDGSKTGDIYLSGQFLQRVTVNGQEYSVYQLNAMYASQPALTKANFANVAFDMTLLYEDSDGYSLKTRNVTLSVYQRM